MANKNDLISRKALLDLYDKVHVGRPGGARRLITDAPAVDAVEVVRCRNCTYWNKSTVNKKGFLICPASGMDIMANDYCSLGERRNDKC